MKRANRKRSNNKRKLDNSNFSVKESSGESSQNNELVANMQCVLHEKCSHPTDNNKDLKGQRLTNKRIKIIQKHMHQTRKS